MAENWGKEMHGQFPRSLHEKSMNKEQSRRWLKYEHIKEGGSRKYKSGRSGMGSHHKLFSKKTFERKY